MSDGPRPVLRQASDQRCRTRNLNFSNGMLCNIVATVQPIAPPSRHARSAESSQQQLLSSGTEPAAVTKSPRIDRSPALPATAVAPEAAEAPKVADSNWGGGAAEAPAAEHVADLAARLRSQRRAAAANRCCLSAAHSFGRGPRRSSSPSIDSNSASTLPKAWPVATLSALLFATLEGSDDPASSSSSLSTARRSALGSSKYSSRGTS
mmetsp:Transcript_68708/g.223713  ORF Transcript_68708/g.223713 Transcript_68708/m.223713 type:complete len:208 (-) Transcript_68708:323-946(-)